MVSSVAAAIIPTPLATNTAAQNKVSAKASKPLIVAIREGSLRTLDPNNAYEPAWFVFGIAPCDQLVTIKGSKSGQVAPDFASAWNVSADGFSVPPSQFCVCGLEPTYTKSL